MSLWAGDIYENIHSDNGFFHFQGSADKNVKLTHFAQLASELEENHISHEMITYSGAPHAFTVFGSKRHRKDAGEK
ncbi:MAG: prolyl oligopeptidase family serine peptidase [Bacteriovoracaceae bacterium]|nr:prolyl oligopeptidase family serine peptidase [Bacteriovoracaceae bacterium]